MTDCSKIPTITDVENSKKGMNDIVQFAGSNEESYVSEIDGLTRKTVTGISNEAKKVFNGANGNDRGDYTVGVVFENDNDYYKYERNGVRESWTTKDTVSLPYTSSDADPGTDVNLTIRGDASQEYVRMNTHIPVNSVSDMVSGFTVNDVGLRIAVDDYYGGVTPSNSGVLFFKVVPDGTGTPDGGKFIQGNGVQFEQNMKLITDVKAFGARGDGVTDDSSIIQTVLDYDSNTCFFPKGNYKVSNSVNLDSQVGRQKKIFGAHKNESQINVSGDLFNCKVSNSYSIEISELRIVGDDTGNMLTVDCRGVFLGSFIVDRIEVFNFIDAIYVYGDPAVATDGIGWVTFTKSSFRNNKYGFRNSNCVVNICRFRDLNIYQNDNGGNPNIMDDSDSGCGIRIDKAESILIEGCDLEANAIGAYITNSTAVTIDTAYYEANNKAAFVVENCSNVVIAGALQGLVDFGVFGCSKVDITALRGFGGKFYTDVSTSNLISTNQRRTYIRNKDKTQLDPFRVNVEQFDTMLYPVQSTLENVDLMSFSDGVKLKSAKRRPDSSSGWNSTSDLVDKNCPIGNTVYQYVGVGSFSMNIDVISGDSYAYSIIGSFPNTTKVSVSGSSSGFIRDFSIKEGGYLRFSLTGVASSSEIITVTVNNSAGGQSDSTKIVGHTIYSKYNENENPVVVTPFESSTPILLDTSVTNQVNSTGKHLGRSFMIGDVLFFVGGYSGEPVTPEGWIKAPVGSVFINKSGSGSVMYVKESGTGNTGWVGK